MEWTVQSVKTDYCRQFQHRARQTHYLRYFEAMSPEARQALQTIYDAAQATEGGAQHVLHAMQSGLHHPDIFRLARENIALRAAMAWARTIQDDARCQQIAAILEDFHIALDAFMGDLSLEAAAKRRTELEASQDPMRCSKFPESWNLNPPPGWREALDGQLTDIAQFKSRIRPVLQKLRQKQQPASVQSTG